MYIDPVTLIIAFMVVAVGANYGYPALNKWQARKATEKRLKEAINR